MVRPMTAYCDNQLNHPRTEFTVEDLMYELDRLSSLCRLPIYTVILKRDSSHVDSGSHFKIFESTSINEATLIYNACIKNKLENESFALYCKEREYSSAPTVIREC